MEEVTVHNITITIKIFLRKSINFNVVAITVEPFEITIEKICELPQTKEIKPIKVYQMKFCVRDGV